MKVEVKISALASGLTIDDVEPGDAFVDDHGEVMFMTQDCHIVTYEDLEDWEDEEGEKEDTFDRWVEGDEVRVAYRLSDGEGYYYSYDEPVQRVLEFAKVVE